MKRLTQVLFYNNLLDYSKEKEGNRKEESKRTQFLQWLLDKRLSTPHKFFHNGSDSISSLTRTLFNWERNKSLNYLTKLLSSKNNTYGVSYYRLINEFKNENKSSKH
mgnify:CR=1 FL=1